VTTVSIPLEEVSLAGDLTVPLGARGVVLFAHGSGSSRHSSRNRYVAEELNRRGLATLLMDLLTEEEEWVDRNSRHLRFDTSLLARRLGVAIDWLAAEPTTSTSPVGVFGASTGGGAAIVAATLRPDRVEAVVSRGGRPDLAQDALEASLPPTLLIVGGDDPVVIELNQAAFARMSDREHRIVIVPGATHLFDEPGALENVGQLAGDWFEKYL
jgi:dienelactone hydrolase